LKVIKSMSLKYLEGAVDVGDVEHCSRVLRVRDALVKGSGFRVQG